MNDQLHHLAAAYALDALSEDERREFEAHYPTCAICNGEVQDFRETAAHLAQGVATPPPDGLRRSVMDEIATTRQLAPRVPEPVPALAERRRRVSTINPLVAAAAAAVIAVAGTLGVLRLTARAGDDDLLAVLQAPDAETAELEGGTGAVRIVWSDALDRAAVVGAELEPAGAGRAYALWSIDGDGASPVGLFTPDRAGSVAAVLAVDDGRPQAWGVTIEPASGSPRPTGPVLFTAEIE